MPKLHTLSVPREGLIGTLALAGLLATFASSSQAATIVLNATDSGWHSSGGNHTASNENYIAGWTNEELRNFFVFDLSVLPAGQTILGATLRAYNPAVGEPEVSFEGGYDSPDSSELYELYEVLAPATTVTAPSVANTAVFDDLGDGTVFGSVTADAGDNGQNIDVALNAAGLAQLSTFYTLASSYVLGGSIATLTSSFGTEEFVWGHTDPPNANQGSPYDRQLIIQLTPEPSTALLMALGLIGVGVNRRRA